VSKRRGLLLPGCLLVLLSAVFGLVGGGLVVAGSISGTAVDRNTPYHWNGGEIVLLFQRFTTCEVVPDSGERRIIEPANPREEKRVDSWFGTSATVTCNQPVRIWQGSTATLRNFTSSSAFEYGLAALVVLPLVALVWLVFRRIARRS
jgi:hypothetical protein